MKTFLNHIFIVVGALLFAASSMDAGATYLLGPGDRVNVNVRDLKEIEIRPGLVELDGTIELQHAGRLQAEGLTTLELAREIEKNLSRIVREPRVTVEVTEYGSQPVSILGAVNKPGVHQLKGGKNLVEVLALAEGLKPEAGNVIKITRSKAAGRIPLANAKEDSTGQFTTAEVGVKSLLEATSPEENIAIRPRDIISIPRASVIYIMGSVRKPGGFPLAEKESISVLQAIALAEGMVPTAAPQNARILRASANGPATEVQVDVRMILQNKQPDQPLRPNDVLVIPNSAAKNAGMRALEVAIQMATGIVIWGR